LTPSLVQSADAEALSDVMIRLSDYLGTLGAQVRKLEHEIGEELCAKTPQLAQVIIHLQSLDYLRQSLEDLARLALLLGHTEGTGSLTFPIAAEISAKLTLNDTKVLVCSRKIPAGSETSNDGSGDLDLF
jgi:hypothetical protein